MNRRMVRAKAARKWHAAHQRQVQRMVAGAMARMVDSLVDSILAHATLGETMRDAARAVQGFFTEALARRAVRQVMADLPRFHAGGPVGMRPGEVAGSVLAPGRLFMRERGSSAPMRYVGTTGPVVVVPLRRCGTCDELIRPDALTGTRCGCTP